MAGQGWPFFQALGTEMRRSCRLIEPAADRTKGVPARLNFPLAVVANDAFPSVLKESLTELAERRKKEEFGEFHPFSSSFFCWQLMQ